MKVYLIGVGLGCPATLTLEAKAAIEESAVLIGAKRLLEAYPNKACIPAIRAEEIAHAIAAQEYGPAAVLLSGDIGFYSGAQNIYPLLDGCENGHENRYEIETFPGVSSLVYFCAKLHIPWEDVRLVSAHGRAHNAVGEIQCHRRTFVLTGGKNRAEDISRELTERGLGNIRVSVGERLGYPEQRIVTGTAKELSALSFDSLSVLLAENPHPIERPWNTPGLSDSDFQRGSVPMTKEEIRTLAVSKLHLEASHIVWDIGAGTGSVSVEGAYAVPAGRVYAVERKPEAVALLEANKRKFGLSNIHIVSGQAPAVLGDLPTPDRVFLGGTAGCMEATLRISLEKNPKVRVVATAVTLETIAETLRCFSVLGMGEPEVIQITATRVRKAGSYHMMDAQNPVWILCGEGIV